MAILPLILHVYSKHNHFWLYERNKITFFILSLYFRHNGSKYSYIKSIFVQGIPSLKPTIAKRSPPPPTRPSWPPPSWPLQSGLGLRLRWMRSPGSSRPLRRVCWGIWRRRCRRSRSQQVKTINKCHLFALGGLLILTGSMLIAKSALPKKAREAIKFCLGSGFRSCCVRVRNNRKWSTKKLNQIAHNQENFIRGRLTENSVYRASDFGRSKHCLAGRKFLSKNTRILQLGISTKEMQNFGIFATVVCLLGIPW